jgi:hypothetical protein
MKGLQRCIFFLALGIFLGLVSMGALANPALYTVKTSVDVTGSSASEAKDQALEQAKQEAFSKLLSRLSVVADLSHTSGFSKEDIAEYIKSFSIQQEERSSIRYRAVIAFQFEPQKVQSALKQKNISFSEQRSTKLVVLPILIRNGRFILWDDDENIWHKAWAVSDEETEGVQIVCPLADLEDQAIAPIASLTDLKKPALLKLKDRYKTDDVSIAVLSLEGEGEGLPDRGYIRFLPFALQDHQNIQTIGPFPFSQESDLLPKKELILRAIEHFWREKSLTHQAQRGIIKVSLEVDGSKLWKQSLKKIENLPMVQAVTIRSFTKTKAVLWVHFDGTLDHLQEKLAYEGFIVEGDHSLMVLKR